ncbi:hypothetical protein PoB_000866600 [Plakobranchus ocellatus]|uniref:Uncharacterized protein n=1 Tax=Plakobranchus ocellatus TaxID=259542 RepID=A0AAV3Y4L2_9GAST|nr:hypothetical protein PoB_000866600 [Plakobranchus ocellatus]
MIEPTVPCGVEEANTYKREKYIDLSKELEKAGYKSQILPIERPSQLKSGIVSVQSMGDIAFHLTTAERLALGGFVGTSAYNLLSFPSMA